AQRDLDRLGRRGVLGDRLVAAWPRPVLRARATASSGAGDAVAAAVAGDGGDARAVGVWRQPGPTAVDRRRDGPGWRAADRVARAEQVADAADAGSDLGARFESLRFEVARRVAEIAPCRRGVEHQVRAQPCHRTGVE